VIDCSATSGLTGINLLDCPNGTIKDGLITKSNVVLQASSSSTRMNYKMVDTVVDLQSWATTGVYVSSANKVKLRGLEVFGGQEGIGIYNGSKYVKHSQCDCYSHTQDGFVIIAGTHIEYSGCNGISNGQSGFVTQRQTSGRNTLKVSYQGCFAESNTYDGFDLRGATTTPWNVDIDITCVNCQAYSNTGTGFYVVNAEGTALTGCVAGNNLQQNFFVNTSARTQLSSCRSISGASSVTSGTSKAGLLVYDSSYCQIVSCISSNSNDSTHVYGVSFTGSSLGGTISGGYYENNTTSPVNLSANRMVAAQAETLAGASVFLREVSFLGVYQEEGFGVPSHTRPKGSVFMRTDGGSSEMYVSNGGGSWTAH